VKPQRRYPRAIHPQRVGKYPALVGSGAGYVWDEVLEYRVWCHPERGAPDIHRGDDYYYAFPTFPKALAFSQKTPGAEEPLVLIRQRQSINEPKPGEFIHDRKPRLTEWQVKWLAGSRRKPDTLKRFFAEGAPENRLDIIQGLARWPKK
jgi:hypothetical protein